MDIKFAVWLKIIALTLLVLNILFACTVYKVNHEPKVAVSAAMQFANDALIKHDFVSAYELLQEKKPDGFTANTLENLIIEMHIGVELPDSLEPYMYRVQPQSKIINVYLKGQNRNSSTFYNVTLEGTRETGYVVTEFFRNPEKVLPDPFSILSSD